MIGKVIDEAVEQITRGENRKKAVSEKLALLKGRDLSGFKDVLEGKFVSGVEKAELNCRVAGVDSGFVGKSLSALDITLIRAVGAVMDFEGGKLKCTQYWPARYDFPVPYLSNSALEQDEYNCSKSLLRLREEVRVKREIIGRFKPKYCFIDGSIVPQYADKPRKDSKVEGLYKGIISEFQSLYEVAEKEGCTLVSCVEDSRGSRFRGILQDSILDSTGVAKKEELEGIFDSALLDYVLAQGERSFTFSYTRGIKEHPILMDYDEKWAGNIYAFYLKPAELDRPLRVEFICREGDLGGCAEDIASVVYALSCGHREYSYPSVLIEADLRARLTPEEISVVFNKIMDKLGSRVRIRMRRDSRPF